MSVNFWQDELRLKTYLLGPEDPLPPWHRTGRSRVYPYPMQDDLTDEVRVIAYKALHLENEYLHAIVLPELGGHLYSLYDKVAGREVFYRNNVVKYGLVARRGAWISGGIEFNFPQGHTCVTVSPVPHVISEDPKTGAAGITIGYTDRVSRMRCSVRLSLAPGEARLRQDVMLCNPRPVRQRHYFWTNSAVPAREDLHLVYPATKCRTAAGEHPYPIHDGRDLSWYRNHERPNDIFALDVTEDFFGCYYEELDAGLVHWSDHHLDRGKKFFTWGTADEGMIWVDLLTDADGQYVELQSGRFVDQSTFEFLSPYQAVSWTEYWWPVRGMGGFVWANEQAALNLRPEGEATRVGAMVNHRGGRGKLVLEIGGRPVWSKSCEVRPGQPLSEAVPAPPREGSQEIISLALRVGRREVIRYEHPPRYLREPAIELPKETLRTPDDPAVTAEELCQHAVRQEKWCEVEGARSLYDRALKKDAGCGPAHLGLGRLDYGAGLFEDSCRHLREAVARNAESDEGWYYLAIAHLAQAEENTARDILWRLMGRTACRTEAAVTLAKLAIRDRDSARAVQLLAHAADSPTTRFLATVARRLGGRGGVRHGRPVGAEDPLAVDLAAERWFAATVREDQVAAGEALEKLREATNGDPEAWLEVALEYQDLGMTEEAVELLRVAVESPEVAKRSPMPYYYLAAFADEPETARDLKVAAEADPEYCFPSRVEELAILGEAIRRNPSDWKARLYLGDLLASLGRREEALASWEAAASRGEGNAVLWRNVALARLLWKDDPRAALEWYDRAIKRRPGEYRLYLERERALLAHGANPEERLAAFATAPPEVLRRWEVAARRIECLVQLKRWDQAIEVMQTHKFRPWEGARQMHMLWTTALLGRAAQRRQAGDPRGAIEDYEQALTYPRNLGVGRAAHAAEAKVHWLLAEAAEEAGDGGKRDQHLRAAAEEKHAQLGEADLYTARALRALGREQEAEELVRRLRQWATQRRKAHPDDAVAERVLSDLDAQGTT